MAKNKYMQELSVEELIDELNFFIPEIQREYVWGHNEREILDVFCEDLKEGKKGKVDPINLSAQIEELSKLGKFEEIKNLVETKEDAKSLNIGFLYSYQPNYRMEHFPESDFYNDVYLIDGQQRLTTLFLILFYLSLKENKYSEFIKLFRFNEEQETLAFDYRVRNLTHNFFIDLISNVNSIESFKMLEGSTWFLKEYNNDPTVNAVVKALKIISNHFKDDDDEFFDYLKTNIKFWHFKTEKTDQGEELYITMNSRGKQLEDNETLRAKLFEKINKDSELYWSEKWEKWQDFFWKNRNKDIPNSSDQGFNEFLKSIAGLESYLSDSNDFIDLNDPIYTNRILKYIDLEKIEMYFDAIEYLFSSANKFKANYQYSDWVVYSIELINKLFFSSKTNWFINYNDEKRASERMNMVFLWSTLDYVTSIDTNEEDAIDDIFRFIRLYWVRFNNHDRSVKTINSRVNTILYKGVWSDHNSFDEEKKHEFLNNIEDKVYLREIESSLWKLEDHPLNLNGYQVKNQNITHLVDFDENTTPNSLNRIYEKLCNLFSLDKPIGSKVLSSVLLYYGFYGMKRSPNYYNNWDFSSWRRVIRDIDSPDEMVFKNFFKEYNGNSLEDILVRKQKEFVALNSLNITVANDVIECDNLIDTLRYYILAIGGEKFWVHGRFIAENGFYSPTIVLTTYENSALFNTKGTFRGYNHSEYCNIAKMHQINSLEVIKNSL